MLKLHTSSILNGLTDVFKLTRSKLLSPEIDELSTLTIELSKLKTDVGDCMVLLTNLLDECCYKSSEILDEIQFQNTEKTSGFKFIYKGVNKNLNWADIEEIEDIENIQTGTTNKPEQINSATSSKKYNLYKEIQMIHQTPIPAVKFPITPALEMIKPAIQWYIGDTKHKEGLYMCLTDGCYIEVPFPDIIDGTKNNNRAGSIKCKHTDIDKCLANRELLASRYNSEIRNCNFAHHGDKYIKIGSSFRCPELPHFGNHKTLKSDMDIINDSDIRLILMYSISDILLSNIWWQSKKKRDETIHNLDIVG